MHPPHFTPGKFIVDVVVTQLVEREILKEVRHEVFGKCLYKTFPSYDGSTTKKVKLKSTHFAAPGGLLQRVHFCLPSRSCWSGFARYYWMA